MLDIVKLTAFLFPHGLEAYFTTDSILDEMKYSYETVLQMDHRLSHQVTQTAGLGSKALSILPQSFQG